MELMVDRLLGELRSIFRTFPDPRRGTNTQYRFEDIAMAAFSVFFAQSPSFLDHQRKFKEAHNKSACESLYGMRRIPSDNHIRQQLDGIDPKRLDAAFYSALDKIAHNQQLGEYLQFGKHILIALDGSQFHHSDRVHCDLCSTKVKKKVTHYHHNALCAAIVQPGSNRVINLPPEFIIPQDGHDKQDCETQAAKRWLENNHEKCSHLHPIYLGDDLFSRQPMCRQIMESGGDFIFTAKKTSHETLYDYLHGLELQKLEKTGKVNRHNHTYRYRWMNGMPLTADRDALQVNWLSFEIERKKDGQVTYSSAFVTSIEIESANVERLAKCARSRWKIENESFNMLKNNGYHAEHNFGHGKAGLTNLLLAMNLLAFTFHTVNELVCPVWRAAFKSIARRQRFFTTIDVLNCYCYFEHWHALLSRVINPQRAPP